MAHQHLKDKPTGNPRLSPLQRSLQKTFSCFIYIYTAILTQHRNSSSTDSGSTTPWTHQLQGITRNQHLTAQQRVFLNLPTQGHVMNQRNQWGGGGKERKAYKPNPQSLHHKHSHCQHLKHHCHGNHGTFSPAARRAGKETLVSSLLAG